MASDHKVSISDLVSWNPWLDSEANCDASLYADLEELDWRPVCIGTSGTGGTPTTTATSTTTAVDPGAPTQDGIVAGCLKYYTAVESDGCWSIANDQGITLDDFYAWNPAVGTDCTSLWLGYAYFVAAVSATVTASVTAAATATLS